MTIPTTAIAANSTQLGEYVIHVRQQQRQYHQQMQQRWQIGLLQAERAAMLLKKEFGVSTVFLFGSLLFPDLVHPNSDIDLAVWGLERDRYYETVGTLLCEVKGFSVDIIMLETAQSSLLDCVLAQGIEL